MRPGKYIRNSIETLYFVLFLCDKLGQIFLHVYNGTVIQFFVTSQTFSMAQIFILKSTCGDFHIFVCIYLCYGENMCGTRGSEVFCIFICQALVLLWQHVFFSWLPYWNLFKWCTVHYTSMFYVWESMFNLNWLWKEIY